MIGVIFRLQWSLDKTKMASVSDDRTVRVWDICTRNEGYQVSLLLL
jgi:WD40 repeat protein